MSDIDLLFLSSGWYARRHFLGTGTNGPPPYIKFRDGSGVRDPRGYQKSMISSPKNRKKIWEVSQVFFGEMWALLKSSKNDFPMVRVKNLRSFSSFFCLKNDPPGKSWKTYFSGIPWTLGPSGPSLDSRAQNSVQDSLNESSVRPNGTPVMPVLRSRSTVRKTLFVMVS